MFCNETIKWLFYTHGGKSQLRLCPPSTCSKSQNVSHRLHSLQSWEDLSLSWDPARYGNLTRINLPADAIWTPPVGLLNSWVVQSITSFWIIQFEPMLVKDHVDFITFKICRLETGVAPIIKSGESGLGTLAEVRYSGHVKLFVPAILSISCIMDMTMYPFDIQRCNLKFGEWINLIAWMQSPGKRSRK